AAVPRAPGNFLRQGPAVRECRLAHARDTWRAPSPRPPGPHRRSGLPFFTAALRLPCPTPPTPARSHPGPLWRGCPLPRRRPRRRLDLLQREARLLGPATQLLLQPLPHLLHVSRLRLLPVRRSAPGGP